MRSAAGWSETDQVRIGKRVRMTVKTTGDWKARRLVRVQKKAYASAPQQWTLQGDALADGKYYSCTGGPKKPCEWTASLDLKQTPIRVSDLYLQFSDYTLPDQGGALITATPLAQDVVPGATWRLSVAPKDGQPFTFYVSSDGAIVAIDTDERSGSFIRGTVTATRDIDGCAVPASFSVDIYDAEHPKDPWTHGGEVTLIDYEFIDAMTPADTPIDKPAPVP